MQLGAWLVAFSLVWASAAISAECRSERFGGNGYAICEVDMPREDLRLFLYDAAGELYGQFGAIDSALEARQKTLGFAMNAGMYHKDRSPVGYYLENGTEHQRLITSDGPGNFGLLPNGLLCLQDKRAQVIETSTYAAQKPRCHSATQSGPMLVIDGALHPRFLKDGTSRFIRNGVGTTADGTRAIFAISDGPVNFHDFGTLFRDHLQTPNALYFDGNISRLRAPDLGRNDFGFALGPIIGVVEDIQ